MELPVPYLHRAGWPTLAVSHPSLYLYLVLFAASVLVVFASCFELGQLGQLGRMDPLLEWEAPEAADVSVFDGGRVHSLTRAQRLNRVESDESDA